jgi:hypothetical protein
MNQVDDATKETLAGLSARRLQFLEALATSPSAAIQVQLACDAAVCVCVCVCVCVLYRAVLICSRFLFVWCVQACQVYLASLYGLINAVLKLPEGASLGLLRMLPVLP